MNEDRALVLFSAITEIREEYIDEDRAVNYHADVAGTALNYEVLSEAVSSVRASVPRGRKWKARIDEDFQRRKK